MSSGQGTPRCSASRPAGGTKTGWSSGSPGDSRRTKKATCPSEPVALNLNTASQEELQDLPGVGPVLAERIVAHRDGIGGFTAIEQLQEVPGIGPNKYRDLRDRVRVGAG